MSSPALQAKANGLNAKMEGAAGEVLDEIDRHHIRKLARASFVCATKCYDKAGTKGPADVLQNCVQQCQLPFQRGNALVQQEIGQFQNRLNRNMTECQEKARDLMTDPNQTQKVENALIDCMAKTVDHHIALLKPMKQRIIASLKKVESNTDRADHTYFYVVQRWSGINQSSVAVLNSYAAVELNRIEPMWSTMPIEKEKRIGASMITTSNPESSSQQLADAFACRHILNDDPAIARRAALQKSTARLLLHHHDRLGNHRLFILRGHAISIQVGFDGGVQQLVAWEELLDAVASEEDVTGAGLQDELGVFGVALGFVLELVEHVFPKVICGDHRVAFFVDGGVYVGDAELHHGVLAFHV
eukprot:CAMPEP_0198114870 /NCGR_PEP_ID=MMETSP1442-20131203/6118_1 /TAXON_ID= /ORGANISM="Craspedostauros australis, Strain CCMP3328" /LENGTH=358 /DNA_ID=CAMNT_0043772269 /DNA_START=74 /DNA_END=1153 /DNA_ORIENTATION=+